MYADALQTNDPDLTAFYSSGGKALHLHGESDPSVRLLVKSTITSQSVASCIQNMTLNDSTTGLGISIASFPSLEQITAAPTPRSQTVLFHKLTWR
jgi:hypothetical protein